MAGLDPAIHVSPAFRSKTWMPGSRPGMTSYSVDAASSRRDDLLALLAEPVDAKRDDIAGIEEGRRLHPEADAGRRPRGEDVAGQQRQELRDIGEALRHREDHGRGAAGLAALAVDVEPHPKLL